MNLFLNNPQRRPLLIAAGLLAAAGIALAAAATSTGSTAPEVKQDPRPVAATNTALGPSYAPIVKRVAPSVVKVSVTANARLAPVAERFYGLPPGFEDILPFGRQQQVIPQQEGLGSGVIASADGYILTNNHVVQGADKITIGLSDGRQLSARVVGRDEATDLAVVKVDARGLPAIVFADSDKVEVGDRVLALGNPFGYDQTVTSGMVSGLGRQMGGMQYEDFIQTDAAINPGNSGGALVDAEGRLIGINTAIVSRSGGSQGIGFAIPANMALSVMRQLVETGKVTRGFLGVTLQPGQISPAMAKALKLPTPEGAIIASVNEDTPAARGGLQEEDVIVRFNGRRIADSSQLRLAVASLAPGSKATAEVFRDGQRRTLEFTIGELQPDRAALSQRSGGNRLGQRNQPRPQSEGTLDGVTVDNLNPAYRREFEVPSNVRGVLVVDVDPASASASAGLAVRDVILEINRQPVTSAAEAVALTEKASADGVTLLKVWRSDAQNRQGVTMLIAVDESGE